MPLDKMTLFDQVLQTSPVVLQVQLSGYLQAVPFGLNGYLQGQYE